MSNRTLTQEKFLLCAPAGFSAAMKKAAQRQMTTSSGFARLAIVEKIRSLGIEIDDVPPAPEPKAPRQ